MKYEYETMKYLPAQQNHGKFKRVRLLRFLLHGALLVVIN